MEIGLAVPLSMSQIEVANRLHAKLLQWQITDQALHALHVNLPGFDIEATLLKVAAVNQLYGTNVYAVMRMAQHVTEVMQGANRMEDADLVKELASLNSRKHLSFASKFAHFFIDMERFPIYDSYAVKMVAYHLGRHGQDRKTEYPYKAFVEDLHILRRNVQFSCSTRELDHYLWLAGLYQVWLRNPVSPINIEVKELFKILSSVTPDELTKLRPTCSLWTRDISSIRSNRPTFYLCGEARRRAASDYEQEGGISRINKL